jgi:quercetin dioxygenase-like cupin family protein
MQNVHTVLIYLLLIFNCFTVQAQQAGEIKTIQKDSISIAAEVRAFFDSYGDDMRKHRREAIAIRYDTSGYYRMGNGNKRFYTFEQTKNRYLKTWVGPKSFEWKDLSIIVLSPEIVAVTGLFDLGDTLGVITYSYSGLLIKRLDGWRIRVEDESVSTQGYSTQAISGNTTSGLYKYRLTARPGASITAHRHSADMKITVRSGRKFILMGNLDKSIVQRFDIGSSLLIPANTWHMEWWEEETVEEIEIMAPWKTERATPITPRKP